MSIFMFVRSPLQEALGQVVANANLIQEASDRAKRQIQIISGAWIGGDADAHGEEVMTRLVPMYADYFAALSGINTNTTKATGIMDRADTQAKGKVSQLKGVFQGI